MHNYELARMNLQLFGEDENEAIERITDINEDYPGDGKTFPDGMGQEDLTNALTVCAGQLIRIADTLDELNKSLKKLWTRQTGIFALREWLKICNKKAPYTTTEVRGLYLLSNPWGGLERG